MTNQAACASSGGEACPGCEGRRVQARTTDGIKVLCPVCGGTGIMAGPVGPYFPIIPRFDRQYPDGPVWMVPCVPTITCGTTSGAAGFGMAS